MSRKKVGLALSSGAARGLAHLGVLTQLQKRGVPIDMITGTSIGAIVGALYAAGKDVPEIAGELAELSWRGVISLANLALPSHGFIKSRRITQWLRKIIGDIDFKDLKIPFACVATDVGTCTEVVMKEGSVAEAVSASACIPVIFTPSNWQGRYLVDGALINPMPVRLLRDMGAELVIAVNVVPYISDRLQKAQNCNPGMPNIFSVLLRTIQVVGYQAVLASMREADVTITPDVAHIRPDNFGRVRECISRGKTATELAFPEIQNQLKSLEV